MVAAACVLPNATFLYKGRPVHIVETCGPTLRTIQYTDEIDAVPFTLLASKLKPVVQPKPKAAVKPHAYSGSLELLLWAEDNFYFIEASAPDSQLEQFAANLLDANGQVFAADMEGFSNRARKAWFQCFIIHVASPLPDNLFQALEDLQNRCGVRKGQSISRSNPSKFYSSELGWELLRRGHKLGQRPKNL